MFLFERRFLIHTNSHFLIQKQVFNVLFAVVVDVKLTHCKA
jgi:hypothetical protein